MTPLTLRDRVVARVANAILRLASARYQAFVAGAIEYGMRAAAADAKAGRGLPADWRVSS